jgi:hypothetical protein
MIKWALKSFKTFLFFTRKSFIDKRMELLLFPSVAKLAFLESFASFFITGNEGA